MNSILLTWLHLLLFFYVLIDSWASTCTNDSSYYFDVATFILTQSALDDGPNRYKTYVEEAEDDLNSMSWPRSSAYPGCGETYAIYGDQATKNITFTEDQLSISITSTGFYIYAEFYISFTVPVWAKFCVDPVFGWDAICICDTICPENSNIYGSGTIKTSTDVNVSVDGNGGLIFTYTPTVDTSDFYFDYHECDDASWIVETYISWSDLNIQDTIHAGVESAISDYIASLNRTVGIEQSYSPYDGVNVSYYVSNLEFQASNHTKFSIKAILSTIDSS